MRFFLSPEHPCSYLPEQTANSAFYDPHGPHNPALYGDLLNAGFRRSGEQIYRPHCRNCVACIPVRIPTANFKPNRSQRRNLKRNADLSVISKPAIFNDEHFDLYTRYLDSRHHDSEMNNPTPEQYLDFLTSRWSDTRFYEIRDTNQLLGIAVVDVVPDALSAFYTFFSPDHRERGLGVFAVLKQVEFAQQEQRPWVYLGYWIEDCKKMAYKSAFTPLETLSSQGWENINL